MTRKRFLIIIALLAFASNAFGQDSIRSTVLEGVEVQASSLEDRDFQPSRDTIGRAVFEKAHFQTVGDAVKFLGGVSIRDYGGVGGMKTASVRAMGAMHTGVTYDGVNVTDNRNGQTDLSKFRTENIEELSLSNGNRILRLQTARSLSAASILSIETPRPDFAFGERANGYVSAGYGSCNLGIFSALANFKFSERLRASLYADILSSKGDYDYTLRYGASATDSTSREKRQNNDMVAASLEANLFFDINQRSNLRAKAYFYYSEKGLPGPTTLYWQKSKQRLWDRDAFVQTVYTNRVSETLEYRNHFKLSNSHTRYTDPLFNNSRGGQDDRYTQNEVYINNILAWHKQDAASLSLTNDLSLAKLDARNNYVFSPLRFSSLTALTGALRLGIFRLDANILHTYTHDYAKEHPAFESQNHISPFVSLSVGNRYFDVAVFYKDIFRLPTFNELYYNAVGKPTLRPEKTKQYNLHLAVKYDHTRRASNSFALSIDLYHNDVTDKIVAIPRNNLFVWSMVNYGKARVDGFEAKAVWKHQNQIGTLPFCSLISLSYNFTKAIDNEPSSTSYRNQLQYLPQNSMNTIVSVDLAKVNLCYTLAFCGKRYTTRQNSERDALAPYSEHSLSASYSLRRFTLKLSCNNLTNSQYEIVRSYPMQGRQWIINLKYKF